MDPRDSPHVAQVFQPGSKYVSRSDLPFTRTIGPDFPRLPYRRRKDEMKTVVHWGQRKLLLSEIEFLTLHSSKGDLVVYAGAAPGTHVQILATLFSELNFILFDPAPFTVKETSNIVCRQELFTDLTAQEFADKDPLFICDIRASDWGRASEDEVEEEVARDMQAQMRWHELMNAKHSMLKFRLSWRPGKTTYLAGLLYLPIWGPITTTEGRLMVPRGSRKQEYNNTEYEEQMFYFNTTLRVGLFPHHVTGEGLDHCYDCAAEIHVLREYFLSRAALDAVESIDDRISKLSFQISRACGKHRTLASGNINPEERKKAISHRQWIDGAPAYETAKKRKRDAEEDARATLDMRVEKGEYSKVSMKLMKQAGYTEGQGLGSSNQGMLKPLTVQAPAMRRGFGFDIKKFNFNTPDEDGASEPTLPSLHEHQTSRRKLNSPHGSSDEEEKDWKILEAATQRSSLSAETHPSLDKRLSVIAPKNKLSLDQRLGPQASHGSTKNVSTSSVPLYP